MKRRTVLIEVAVVVALAVVSFLLAETKIGPGPSVSVPAPDTSTEAPTALAPTTGSAFELTAAGRTASTVGRASRPPAGTAVQRTVDPRYPAGAVTQYDFADHRYHRTRTVWVYTPPGYSTRDSSDALLICFDGGVYLDTIPLPLILDTLLATHRAPPMVAVMIDDGARAERIDDLGNRAEFVELVARDIVGWARRNWNVTADPRRTIATGSSAGGLAAAYVALRHPEVVGNVLSQSAALWRGNEGSNDAPYEWLTGAYAAAPKRDVRFVLEVGALETHGALGGAAPSILEANRHLRDVLTRKGYAVTYAEVPGGVHAPESWRVRLPGVISQATARMRN